VTHALLRNLRATSPAEVLAVGLGIVYVLLILKRNRWGWVAGGLSSAIYVFLSARALLPMQSVLQSYYVLMAIYGWFSWTRSQRESGGAIGRWPLRLHLIAVAVIVLMSLLTARWLARATHAAWPLLDSLTTWSSLLATWLVARMKLENWIYWICADTVMVFLFTAQGYAFTACLFLTYIVIAVFGYREWQRKYRLQRV